jgi:hypothetical protein
MEATPTPALNKALARATAQCHAIKKRGEVRGKRTSYKFARSEDIIAESRDALSENGLSLLPISSTLMFDDSGRVCGVDRTWSLRHESGESITIGSQWPATSNDWRQPEKAIASSATTCLGYQLRDILLLPRVDEEVDQDDEGDVSVPKTRRVAPAKKKATAPRPSQHRTVSSVSSSINSMREKAQKSAAVHATDREKLQQELSEVMFPEDKKATRVGPPSGSTKATNGSGKRTMISCSVLQRKWQELMKLLRNADAELGLKLTREQIGDMLIDWAKARTGVHPILTDQGNGKRIANGDLITTDVMHALYDEFEEWYQPLHAAATVGAAG